MGSKTPKRATQTHPPAMPAPGKDAQPDATEGGIGREPQGVQPHIADADKKARIGTEHESVRNTPPAGDWNDVP